MYALYVMAKGIQKDEMLAKSKGAATDPTATTIPAPTVTLAPPRMRRTKPCSLCQTPVSRHTKVTCFLCESRVCKACTSHGCLAGERHMQRLCMACSNDMFTLNKDMRLHLHEWTYLLQKQTSALA
ncbi:Aste57867_17575 [Aphanomyces stellatus]|uniref:Aste57867_17575 protein n=1 Tax=Aphanomyces stellatus TaxID=120398 RepID=A0A485L8S2_9STRA|nr:hypothetical protein As57867_017515 [Aphanomyces stellatus]VFT94326.1 Aste57867_17575 [Aphanomyces stellatus]